MLLKKLSHEEAINNELLECGNMTSVSIELKKFPGVTFSGFVFHCQDLSTPICNKIAVIFFHGEINDDFLDLLKLKGYVFPDEISEIIYSDNFEITTSELCILKRRMHMGISQISHELQVN